MHLSHIYHSILISANVETDTLLLSHHYHMKIIISSLSGPKDGSQVKLNPDYNHLSGTTNNYSSSPSHFQPKIKVLQFGIYTNQE